MNTTTETPGSVLAGGSVVALARIETADGQLLQTGDVSVASYSIVGQDPCGAGSSEPVAGHTDQSLTPAAVLYDTLQTGAAWDVDATGYNFRHEIDVTGDPAFAVSGRTYSIRYELTPASGQPILLRYSIKAI